MNIFPLLLVAIVFFNIAFWLLAMTFIVAPFQGISHLLPWVCVCWAIGMAASFKREVGEKCRWFGWFLLGAICMYVGIFRPFMRTPQTLPLIDEGPTWSYSSGKVHFGNRKDFVFKKLVTTHPAKLENTDGKSVKTKATEIDR